MNKAIALVLAGTLAWSPALASADDGRSVVESARYRSLTEELRCLVCQNQTLADSQAPLAVDLKREILAQMQAGRSDAEIVDYLVARYGDFVRYRPPVQANTLPLWLGPLVMLAGGLWWLAVQLRRIRRTQG